MEAHALPPPLGPAQTQARQRTGALQRMLLTLPHAHRHTQRGLGGQGQCFSLWDSTALPFYHFELISSASCSPTSSSPRLGPFPLFHVGKARAPSSQGTRPSSPSQVQVHGCLLSVCFPSRACCLEPRDPRLWGSPCTQHLTWRPGKFHKYVSNVE